MFKKDEKVIYSYEKDKVEHIVKATILDPGSTVSTIMMFDSSPEGGIRVLPVDNTMLTDEETWIKNNRDKRIHEILK